MDVASYITPLGGLLEVVISFDTTGSMSRWLDELRGRVQDLIQRLQADIPGIRIAVFAHGDYCDALISYVTKWIDLTVDVMKLCDFVKNVERTGGGDAPECYELVLRQARTELSWTPGSRRVLVMIGDDIPHEPGEACNKDNIDWRAEVKALAETAVIIYGVQCGQNFNAGTFYETISMATGGKHLKLEQLDSLFHTLMAVCYREVNDLTKLANYEKEVRAGTVVGGIAADIDAILTSFRNDVKAGPCPIKTTAPLTIFSKEKKATTTGKISTPDVNKLLPPRHVKMVSGRKSRNCKTTTKSKFDKFKESNLPLLKRENVPENNFSLRSLHWSSWTQAMVCNDDYSSKENAEMWVRRVGRPGYRLKLLPVPKSFSARARSSLALFEVAVQGKDVLKKRYVVFSAFSSRSLGARNWEKHLLGVARSQIDFIVNSGGRVYIRFCLVTTKPLQATAQRNIRRYDYAWRKVRKLRACPRDVVKGHFAISKSGL